MSKPFRAAADEFRDYCLELLSSLAPRGGVAGIAARRMFGGTGFSMDGKTFAIIAFDQLWLKADETSRGEFEQAGCSIFTYEADGKTRTMGYYTVPPDAMESAALMRPWAELAWGAALRAAAGKNRPKQAAVAKSAAESVTRGATAKPKTLASPRATTPKTTNKKTSA